MTSVPVSFPRPSGAPELSDDVIRLRPWRPPDAAALIEMCNDDAITRWLDQMPQPYTLEHATQLISSCEASWREQGEDTPLAIADVSTDEPVGQAVLFWEHANRGVVELGYWVGSQARGRGIASRAVSLLCVWLFAELGYERVELRVEPANVGSRRVAEKAGFSFEGVARSVKWHARSGDRLDLAIYSRLPGDAAPE